MSLCVCLLDRDSSRCHYILHLEVVLLVPLVELCLVLVKGAQRSCPVLIGPDYSPPIYIVQFYCLQYYY